MRQTIWLQPGSRQTLASSGFNFLPAAGKVAKYFLKSFQVFTQRLKFQPKTTFSWIF